MRWSVAFIFLFILNNAHANSLCDNKNAFFEKAFTEFNKINEYNLFVQKLKSSQSELDIVKSHNGFKIDFISNAQYKDALSSGTQKIHDDDIILLFEAIGQEPSSEVESDVISNSYNYGINVSKTLFDFGKNNKRILSTEQLVHQQKNQIKDTHSNNKRQFLKLYFDFLKHKKKKEINAALLKKINRIISYNDEMSKKKIISYREELSLKGEVLHIKRDFLKDDELYNQLLFLLMSLTDSTEEQVNVSSYNIEIPELPHYSSIDVNKVVQNSFLYLEKVHGVEKQLFILQYIENPGYNLSFNAKYVENNLTSKLQDTKTKESSIGVRLNIPLYSATHSSEIEKQLSNIKISQRELYTLERKLRKDIEDQFIKVNRLQQEVTIHIKSIKNLEKILHNSEKELLTGLNQMKDVYKDEVELMNSQRQLLEIKNHLLDTQIDLLYSLNLLTCAS